MASDWRSSIRIPAESVSPIWRQAEKRNLPVTVMLREWVLDRLAEELADETEQARARKARKAARST